MEKQQIFWGLNNMNEEVAKELAIYWKVAGNAEGVIDTRGYLTTAEMEWKRPCAADSFKALKEALDGNWADWLEVCEDSIKLDFGKLSYNPEWVKEIIAERKLGVSNCRYGLLMFVPKMTGGQVWYSQQTWELQGVTVESLGLNNNAIMPVSPDQEDPRSADWRNLYFAG